MTRSPQGWPPGLGTGRILPLTRASRGRDSEEPYLDEGPDDAQAGEAQVLKGAGLAHSVEEGVEVQRDVSCRITGVHISLACRSCSARSGEQPRRLWPRRESVCWIQHQRVAGVQASPRTPSHGSCFQRSPTTQHTLGPGFTAPKLPSSAPKGSRLVPGGTQPKAMTGALRRGV